MRNLEKKSVIPENAPPMLCIVGFSGSGKTTVTVGLIETLKKRGLRVGTIKHDVHGFEMDRPGKDSWRHKQAGASTTIISSPYQIGLVMDVDMDHKPDDLLPFLKAMDIVLAEGYKRENLPKIEVFRAEISTEPVCKDDDHLLAIISESRIDLGIPKFAFHDIHQVADFILDHFNLIPRQKP